MELKELFKSIGKSYKDAEKIEQEIKIKENSTKE